MNRSLIFALLALACLAAARPALAAEGALDFTIAVDPAALLAAAPAPQPGEDGLVVYEAHHYRYADGLMRHRHQRLLRVTTEWALERLADPRLRFDSARQKITVHAARTYLPGGGAVDSPSNAFNTVTPGELALAPDFLDIQEQVITHIGLEPGCALWLDTEIVDTAPAGLPEGALLFPQGEFPVLAMDVTAEGLYAELVNPEGGLLALPAGTGEALRHSWHFENLPAAPGQATYRLGDQLPHLNISPLKSWEYVVTAIEASIETAVTDTIGLGTWLADVKRDLDRPFLDDRDAISAIATALAERTNLLDGPDWVWRAPRSVARVLETSVATPLERTAIMVAACRWARALPTCLELPSRWEDEGSILLPLAALTAPWLRKAEEVEQEYFSPAEGRLRRPFENVGPRVFYGFGIPNPLVEGSSPRVYHPGYSHPGVTEVEGFKVTAVNRQYWDLAEGSFALAFRIEPADLWKALQTPETALREWCAGWTDSSRVEVLELHDWSQLGVMADLTGMAPLPAADEAGRVRLALPMPPMDLAELLPPGMNRTQSTCRTILFPPHPVELHLSWILDLPSDLDPVAVPAFDLKCHGARIYASRREISARRLEVQYSLTLSGDPIPPDEYPAFRALVNAALDPKTTEVLLVPRAKD